MSIRRAPRPESNFYLLDKTISEDQRLSWGARGMLIFLLGKPDHWEVSVANLIKQTAQAGRRSGRDAVYGFLKELENTGYLKRNRNRADGGAFESVDYVVCEDPETPLTENPDVVDPPHPDLPDPVQPYPANPTQVSIEGLTRIEGSVSTEREKPALPSEPRPQLDDFGRPMQPQPPIDLPEKFSMHRDWKPDAKQLKTEFYRRGMGMNVEYQSGDLIDFTAYFADLPGMQRSHSWWTARFAGWVQKNRADDERKQQRQQTTGDNDNANGTGADQNDQRRARDGVRDLLANPRDTSWADGLWTDSDNQAAPSY